MHRSLNVDATAWHLTPGFLLYGIGMGLIMPHISNLTLSAVSVEAAGEASGVNNTMRQLGATLGSAIVGAVLLSSLALNLSNGIQDSRVIPQQMKQQLSQVITHQTSNVEFGGGAQVSTGIPANISQEIKRIGQQATTDGNKTALIYSLLFVMLGLVASIGYQSRSGKNPLLL